MTARRKPTRTARVRGGTLAVISVLLIGSALVRIGLQAGPAIARETVAEESHESEPAASSRESGHTSAELQALIDALQTRQHALDIRESKIQDRMKALEIAEEAVDRRLVALESAEQRLAATLALADGASEKDVNRLTSVYEKMKPKQSAALFEQMDPEFAAGFLSRMRPETAADVMAGLSPMAAYSISVVLAGRNASVPKE